MSSMMIFEHFFTKSNVSAELDLALQRMEKHKPYSPELNPIEEVHSHMIDMLAQAVPSHCTFINILALFDSSVSD